MCKSKRHFRKKTKTLSGVLSRHQSRDGRRHVPSRKSSMDNFDSIGGNLDIYMKYNVIKKPTIEDFVSADDSEKLHCIAAMNQIQLEHQEQSRSREEEVQVTDSYDEVESTCTYTYAEAEVETTGTESKPNSNKWKWIAGAVAGTGLAGIIAYVIKNK